MRITFPVTSSWAITATLFGCAETTGTREHDAMISALYRTDRDRTNGDDVVFGSAALDRNALVAAVLARNPDLDAARETWRAAAAAYPIATALDDPMASYEVAPFSIGSSVPFGQKIEVRQKLPWPGKRQLAGASALADAEGAEADFNTLRLDLAEATVNAFDDYYVAARALEVNQHHHDLLARIEKSALAQYTVGHGSQQDPLEARAEIIALERERLMLVTRQRTAVAKINRLLRRRADAELPPPPAKLEVTPPLPAATELHPRQLAATAKSRGRQADIEHADRAFYPDFEVMGSYNSMWNTWQHQWMIGVGIEIPLQRDKRRAAVDMARAEKAKAIAELASVTDMLGEDRDRTRREVDEATQALELYEKQLLPVSLARVDAALAGFTAGQNPFSTTVMAEHALRGIELEIEQARADLDRKTAALERAEGRIPGGGK
ncbi:MAG: TolC family protein [Kofleriaceae bacterium]